MSDYLGQLIARVRGPENGVQPLLRSVFEPASQAEFALSASADFEVESAPLFDSLPAAPASSNIAEPIVGIGEETRTGNQSVIVSPPAKTPARIARNDAAPTPEKNHPVAVPHAREPPLLELSHPSPTLAASLRTNGHEPEMNPVTLAPRAEKDSTAKSVPEVAVAIRGPSRANPPREDFPPGRVSPTPVGAEPPLRRREEFSTPPSAVRPVVVSAIRPAPPVPARVPPPPRAAANVPVAEPVIHVSIGRVEIRATSPAVARARPATTAPAGLSLEDYLRQRAGGNPR